MQVKISPVALQCTGWCLLYVMRVCQSNAQHRWVYKTLSHSLVPSCDDFTFPMEDWFVKSTTNSCQLKGELILPHLVKVSKTMVWTQPIKPGRMASPTFQPSRDRGCEDDSNLNSGTSQCLIMDCVVSSVLWHSLARCCNIWLRTFSSLYRKLHYYTYPKIWGTLIYKNSVNYDIHNSSLQCTAFGLEVLNIKHKFSSKSNFLFLKTITIRTTRPGWYFPQ